MPKKNPWKLPVIRLSQEAAEFYVLEFVVGAEEYKPARSLYNKKVKFLANTFFRYLPKAIRSELDCWSEIRDKKRLTPARRRLLYMATDEWIAYYFRYPRRVSKLSFNIFYEYEWDFGFGGRAWASIAKTLMDYNYGRLKAKLFVDRTWSLRHNNNIVFDKEYHGFFSSKNEISTILDLQRRGDVLALTEYCGSAVRATFNRFLRWKEREERRAKRAY